MGLNCKCPTSFLNDQTREFPIIILGIYTVSKTAITKRGRITKHGNASLRKYLYLMAMGLIRCNPHFKAFYDKKRDEGFPHRKAMVALMNKLIKTLFAMLKKKEKFIVQS